MIKDHAIVGDRLGAYGAEGIGHGPHVVVTMAEQIKITSWGEWVGNPGHEEHRPFQNEALTMLGNAQPVEQTF
jgi:hypothetical protein